MKTKTFKKAFTLAEAILTMTILGIIAAVMVTTLKPSQYKQQGFDTLKKKVYSELDGIIQTYIVECAQDMDATKIFDGCNRSSTTHTFGAGNDLSYLGENYMRGTYQDAGANNSGCTTQASYPSLKLRNGVCLYSGSGFILVDVNGADGPNENDSDRMKITIGTDGISNDIDAAMVEDWPNAE